MSMIQISNADRFANNIAATSRTVACVGILVL